MNRLDLETLRFSNVDLLRALSGSRHKRKQSRMMLALHPATIKNNRAAKWRPAASCKPEGKTFFRGRAVADHDYLFGLMRNFSPVARLAYTAMLAGSSASVSDTTLV